MQPRPAPRPASARASAMTPIVRLSLNYCTERPLVRRHQGRVQARRWTLLLSARRHRLVPAHRDYGFFERGIGIGTRHFGSGLVGGEHPVDSSAALVSLRLPDVDLGNQPVAAFDAAIETLAFEHADLDLNHVEPAGVLGRVVELKAPEHAARFGRWGIRRRERQRCGWRGYRGRRGCARPLGSRHRRARACKGRSRQRCDDQ